MLRVEKLLDRSFAANVPVSVISTDECGSLGKILEKESKIQADQFGIEIIVQNDPFHKIKNARKARKAKYKDQKLESQKFATMFEDLKLIGLVEIASQMGVSLKQKN